MASQELAAKRREILRLKAILQDAGSHAKVEESIAPLGEQSSNQILEMVLGRGAAHTLQIHVCRWLAYRSWYDKAVADGTIQEPFYPPLVCSVLYCCTGD